ncbi:MAG: phosphate-starvation-inducible PsiE family protein [Gammaproteobacteria bacterium]
MNDDLSDRIRAQLERLAHGFGNLLVDLFHYIALFAIGAATVWSAVVAFFGMMENGYASIDDILLLFIYLELGAMVGIYFKTNHMPVRFLIYVAITALTRLLLADVQHHDQPGLHLLLVAGAVLLLALATLVIRFGSARFPAVYGEPPGTPVEPQPTVEKHSDER